jgi:DNA-binding GntR family transcriptional regulator
MPRKGEDDKRPQMGRSGAAGREGEIGVKRAIVTRLLPEGRPARRLTHTQLSRQLGDPQGEVLEALESLQRQGVVVCEGDQVWIAEPILCLEALGMISL